MNTSLREARSTSVIASPEVAKQSHREHLCEIATAPSPPQIAADLSKRRDLWTDPTRRLAEAPRDDVTRLRRLAMTNLGFTLVEVMMASIVIAVGILFIHQAFVRSLGAVKHAENVLAASSLAEYAAINLKFKYWDGTDVIPANAGIEVDSRLRGNDIGVTANREDYMVDKIPFDFVTFSAMRGEKSLFRGGIMLDLIEKEKL